LRVTHGRGNWLSVVEIVRIASCKKDW
jgi:hypothetical protein